MSLSIDWFMIKSRFVALNIHSLFPCFWFHGKKMHSFHFLPFFILVKLWSRKARWFISGIWNEEITYLQLSQIPFSILQWLNHVEVRDGWSNYLDLLLFHYKKRHLKPLFVLPWSTDWCLSRFLLALHDFLHCSDSKRTCSKDESIVGIFKAPFAPSGCHGN